VGARSLEHRGKKKWRRHVADVIARLDAALQPDEIVIGGGNAKQLRELPARARLGTNADAFTGGFRMWSSATGVPRVTR
jgi:polyphosphate glucokinase